MVLRLRIENPCSKDFASMPGDARRRFCDACGKHVHDISEATEDEARALLSAHGGRACVRALVIVAAASLAACSAATQKTVQIGPLQPSPKPDASLPDDSVYMVGEISEP